MTKTELAIAILRLWSYTMWAPLHKAAEELLSEHKHLGAAYDRLYGESGWPAFMRLLRMQWRKMQDY